MNNSLESGSKDKTKGQEVSLRELDRRSNELWEKHNRHWISEEEYRAEKEKLEEERLDVLTRPE
jgi:hypothetical protein